MTNSTNFVTGTQVTKEWLNDVDALVFGIPEPAGASLVGYMPAGVGAVATDVQTVLRESVSISGFGAVPAVDCAAALLSAGAATTGVIFIPAGAWVATATTANSAGILALLYRIRCDGALTINLSAGVHSFADQVVVNSPDAQRIHVLGAATVSTTAASQVSVSGAAKAYSVVVGVASSAGVSAGDYATIRTNIAGTGDFYAHSGVWKILAVDAGGANRLTLKNTHHGAAFPANTLTGGTIVILKTVLQFTGCDGFRFEGGQPLGLLDQLAIVGDYDVLSSSGTLGAHGIIGVSPVITGGASSNTVFNTDSQVILGVSVGLSAWGEQGIAISGRGSLVGNYVASCSNRKRGVYADGASFRMKYAVASGNGEDGFIADSSGYLQCAYAIAGGNGMNGFWSTNNSMLAASNAKATGNLTNGFESRGMGRLSADLGIAFGNTANGFSATDGGMIDADSATADANKQDGFFASQGAVIDANNATSKNNLQWGVNGSNAFVNFSGSGAFTSNTLGAFNTLALGVAGYTNSGKFPFLMDSIFGVTGGGALRSGYDGTKYADLIATSLGDLVIKNNGVNSFVAKAQGALHPAMDNTQALGRTSERWSVVYAGTGTINTSDEREKQQIQMITDAERAVAVRIKGLMRSFCFNDAVAEKGDRARIHFGVMAQEVKAAFELEGLVAEHYAMLCYDEWEDQKESRDDDGNVITPYRAAGNRYGVRYEELLAFILAAI